MHASTCCFTLCLLLFLHIAQSIALLLPVCHDNRVKGEFYIPKPSPCIRHKTTFIVNCSAHVYYPNKNFLKVPITTCEVHETTTYFFMAKTNNNYTKPLTPPSVAVYTDWSHSLQSICCGRLVPLSKISWSTTNKLAVVYVWPKTHKEIVRNAILIHSTDIYDHLKKQLILPLNSLANCDLKKGSCIIGNLVHIWKVPDKLDCLCVK